MKVVAIGAGFSARAVAITNRKVGLSFEDLSTADKDAVVRSTEAKELPREASVRLSQRERPEA
jgi:hypothetical protein